MRTHVRKWGNGLAVRIPKAVAEETGLSEDAPVEMTVEDGRIVVLPSAPRRPRLEDLLGRITPSNIHGEADFGPPTGREAW